MAWLLWLAACCGAPRDCQWRSQVVGALDADGPDEASGLVASARPGGGLWALDDGDGPLYLLDDDGALRTVVELEGEPVDLEDLAAGPGPEAGRYLYAADIGDNEEDRQELALWRLPEPATESWVGLEETSVPAERIVLSLPAPADAEALVVDAAGDAWLWTKGSDGVTTLLLGEDVAGAGAEEVVELEVVEEVALGRCIGEEVRITGADRSETQLVLASEHWLWIWEVEASESLAGVMSTAACGVALIEATDPEAVALWQDEVLTLAEGGQATLWRHQAP